jgi:tetratricopeptide (TPR) repeat protein
MSERSSSVSKAMRLAASGLLLFLLNSSYLAAFDEPTIGHIVNLLLHFGLGVVLAVGLRSHLSRAWRAIPLPGRLGGVLWLVSTAIGVGLLIYGGLRPWAGFGPAVKWAGPAHVAVGLLGLAGLTSWILRRRAEWPVFGRVFALTLLGCLIFPVVAREYVKRARADRDYIVNPTSPPLSMEGEGQGPGGPFFPSSAVTNTGGTIPGKFFMNSESCARCHREIYDQWNSSAHHFASFNNQWYRKSIEYMQDTIGTQSSKWCAGCHDHAVLFAGKFDTPIREQINTPEAQAGLGCVSCHSIAHVKSSMGQADFEMEYPAIHALADSDNRLLQWGHDMLTYAKPQLHSQAFIKPFMRENSAEYCASCHKVHLDKPVNNYRWFRGFNDYDNWQASGVSGQGARAFYYPDQPKRCADCHMPLVDSKDPAAKNGKVRSHRFPGANTALPFVNGDREQFETTVRFLQDKQVTIDIFGMTPGKAQKIEEVRPRAGDDTPRLASTFAIGEESMQFGSGQVFITKPAEVIAPLNQIPDATVRRGEEMRLDVVVRTRKVGHFFPGGTVDGLDVWVELQAVDENGKVIFWSGKTEDDVNGRKGPVEKGAHVYRSLMLDERGNPINKRNAWAARSVAYVRLVPPGAADTIHYRLIVPPDSGNRITIRAKINYRKFPWWGTQWAYAGVRDPQQKGYSVAAGHDDGEWVFKGDTSTVSGAMKAIPDLPIITIAEDTATLRVVNRRDPLPEMKPVLNPAVRERWNDYGIGLLLQGDIKGAEAAFLKVTQMEPGYADGWVNVARARIQEGNMAAAAEMLEKALAINPNLAKSHFFLAVTLKSQGRYDEATRHLQIASGQYPRDRVVLNTIGRVLFLQRKYTEAVAALQRVLSVDPEDLQAHYNLMLCYQGLGNATEAERERKLYLRFKADESAQAITGPYRQLHPEDNAERQQIHEHHSVPLGKSRPSEPSKQDGPARVAGRRGGKLIARN